MPAGPPPARRPAVDGPRGIAQLESALREVCATLGELIAIADEQYAAAADGALERLATTSQRQETLASRLERAERRRLAAAHGRPLRDLLADVPAERAAVFEDLLATTAQRVIDLRERHARNAALLERGAGLAGQTVQFLRRLLVPHAPTYGADGATSVRRSVLLDGQA